MSTELEALVVRRTLRVPAPGGPIGDGEEAARRLDSALMSVGFKLSGELLMDLSATAPHVVVDIAVQVLAAMRKLVEDHVQHNAYFIDFPANVPGTMQFWLSCLREVVVAPGDTVNLLALPAYGRYQHSYEAMLEVQPELIESAGDRITVLHAGRGLFEEAADLYVSLAGSTTPLKDTDLEDLRLLAGYCATRVPVAAIPVRENRAVVNAVLVMAGEELLLADPTDVLRLACELFGGDVTLRQPTAFRSIPRPVRRMLLAGLDRMIAANPGKLGDIGLYREPWKRLGERLHPHEYAQWPYAAEVFAVARGERTVRSFAARVEELFGRGDVVGAAHALRSAPGLLMRSLDRLLREAPAADQDAVLDAVELALERVSGRVVLSVREHVENRGSRRQRLFVNGQGRGRVFPDTRRAIDPKVLDRLRDLLDAEVRRRLSITGRVLVDPEILGVALPLTGKASATGFGVLPRGSVSAVDGQLLRFFVYWKQRVLRTDFDLSALQLNADYQNPRWLSYTNLTDQGGRHSGDITEAPDGASEFIDLNLRKVRSRFVIPQVNIYGGEGFDQVEESFFGFMLRDAEQQGRPFEPRTVRMKSELRGTGRVALPMVFMRGEDGRWRAKWLHLHLKGGVAFNTVEGNRISTTDLVRGVVEREYLRVRYLVEVLESGARVELWDGAPVSEAVTFIGMQRPEGLPSGSRVFTPENLGDLIPA
ncbi:TerD family protein [Nocardia concava]|uniref:TerD family protein n=1 Tax=Nocardia concava TaxID=257281 RepID=UPI0005937AF8|nr:TerD family protein [Nocardia concava]